MKKHLLVIALVILPILLNYGCKEDLPSKETSLNVFTATLENSYLYSRNQNGMYFTVTLINTFDETISDVAAIDGELTIEWLVPLEHIRSVNAKRTAKLTTSHVTRARNFNRFSGLLTIDPQDTFQLGYLWNFKFDDSTDIRKVSYYNQGFKKLNCSNFAGLQEIPRIVYRSQPFKIECKVKIFNKMGTLYFPERVVNSCAINFWPNSICPGMQTPGAYNTPCDLF